ncbi:MAG: hemolysin family protein [Verrucomicrobia bacterium]|nr:hemolysin family protein [Verrucomicrobiota bacterium]
MNVDILAHSPQILGILTFLILNALLVSCELSLIKLRFSHFNPELLDFLREDKRLRKALDRADETVRIIRFGTTLCILGYGLFLFPLLHGLLSAFEIRHLDVPTIAPWILSFLFATALHYLVAELIARSLALQFPVVTVRISMPVVTTIGLVCRPFINILNALARALFRLSGIGEPARLESLDMQTQIEMLGEEAPEVTAVAQSILKNALMLRNLVVADVLLPRNQVQIFDLNLSLQENLVMARQTGHTRFPLCAGDLDRCVGLIHIKDLFRYEGDLQRLDLRKIKREIIRVDAEEPLEEALTKLLHHRMHMALVIDEFRGAEGVLTLERILEELVGDIQDEFDSEEEILIQPANKVGEAMVAGLTPLHELEELFGVEISSDDVSTLGGLISTELGRIPEAGEELCLQGLWFKVTEVDETRIIQVQVRKMDAEELSSGQSRQEVP